MEAANFIAELGAQWEARLLAEIDKSNRVKPPVAT